jgi:hypothetical protein
VPQHAAEQGRPDVAAARAAWREVQPSMNPTHLVFLDETWATTNMARRYGRAPRGERVIASVPHGHWKTSTFVAGLRDNAITAPLVIDGAMNGETFRAYIEQFLAPTLAHGDIVIMDNLASHKVAGVREAIEASGASLIYLPPYSPETQSNRPLQSSRPCCAKPPAHRRGPLDRHRRSSLRILPQRMCKLSRRRRVSTVNLKVL